ncbi:MAG: endonuclease [Sumerlaeia bacterium]
MAAGSAWAAPPANYYDTADTTNGTTLRSSLHNIIDGHTVYSYTAAYDIIADANEDPNNSNNTILFYTGRSTPKTNQGGNDSDPATGGYNREHIWPQSAFNENSPMKSDMHALLPADADANGRRSNYPFHTVTTSTYEFFGNKVDTDNFAAGNIFEPRDAVKGDVARALFYMDVRYEGDSGEPNLALSSSGYPTGTGSALMGYLDELLAWHAADPVDQFEIDRHEYIYGFQNNRNPFIDHPEWVDCVYNNNCSNDTTPPDPPMGLAANGGDGSVSLTWNANSEGDLDGYNVYRSTTMGGPYSQINGALVPAPSYVDNTVTNGVTYYYVVTAVDTANNESNDSTPASATPETGPGLIVAGPMAEPATISSLRTTAFDAPWNFDVTIIDDQANPGADSDPTLISQIVFTPGTGNDFANWTSVLAGARLTDGTHSVNGTVGAAGLTFALTNGLNEIGHIADNGTKTYQLKVWLKESATGVDNGNLVFALASSGIATEAAGSSTVGSSSADSGSTNNAIEVVATELRFASQPPDTIVATDFAASVHATDKYGRRDTDASGNVTLSLDTVNAGILSAAGGLTKALAAGLASWSDLEIDTGEAGVGLLANATGFAEKRSESFDVLPSGGGSGTPVFVNEIHYDNDGGDTGEFIEVAGPAGTDLSGWTIVLYNGSSSLRSPYSPTMNLSGTIPDSTGNGFGFLSFFQAGIQNGDPDGLALVDDSNTLIQFLSYDGSFVAASGIAAGLTSENIGGEPTTTPIGESLQLTGTGSVYEDFTWAASTATNTAGALNGSQTFQPAGGTLNANGVLEFASASRAGSEDGGAIVVSVLRLAGTAGAIAVPFSVGGASTASGADYTIATASPLNFADSDDVQSITINPVVDSDHLEGDETIVLQLGAPTGGAALGAQSEVVVTLLASDRTLIPSGTNPPPLEFAEGVRATVDFNDVSAAGAGFAANLVKDNAAIVGLSSSLGVYWDFTVETGFAFGGEVLVTLEYRDGELNGVDENTMTLVKANSPAGPWQPVQIVERDTVNNTISAIVTGFSTFTATNDTVLWVDLVAFEAEDLGSGGVRVTWETAAEVDSLGFHIHRVAPDGGLGGQVTSGLVPATGSPLGGAFYEVLDSEALATGESRGYFLVETETSGKTTTYGPITVSAEARESAVEDWTIF